MIDRIIHWLLEGVYYRTKSAKWMHRKPYLTDRVRIALARFLIRRVT